MEMPHIYELFQVLCGHSAETKVSIYSVLIAIILSRRIGNPDVDHCLACKSSILAAY